MASDECIGLMGIVVRSHAVTLHKKTLPHTIQYNPYNAAEPPCIIVEATSFLTLVDDLAILCLPGNPSRCHTLWDRLAMTIDHAHIAYSTTVPQMWHHAFRVGP